MRRHFTYVTIALHQVVNTQDEHTTSVFIRRSIARELTVLTAD